MDRQKYEEELNKRQTEHLKGLIVNCNTNWQPCLHDACPTCHGTGVGRNGVCVHGIACPCPKCTPYC